MVLKEINHEEAGAEPASLSAPKIKASPLETRLAAPIDRLAATIADFVIFSPIATLVMAPFKRQGLEAQLAANDEAWMVAACSAAAAAAVALILFQTLCLMKWRATPGKMLFGLRVEGLWPTDPNHPKALNPMSAFLRSIVFCLELLMLGLPLLAILGNERRRPFHDRIADTIVISKRARRVGPPTLSELAMSSGLMAAVLTSVALVAAFKLAQMGVGGSALAPVAAVADLESTGDLCTEVGRAEKDWVPGHDEAKPNRISVALGLYEADAIDEECLKQEADYALWKTDQKDLAYLARGLAEKTDDELAQSYLDKACESDRKGEACQVLALLREPEMPDDPIEAKTALVDRENEVQKIIASLTSKTSSFLKIIAIRELSSQRNDAHALELVESISPQKELGFFLASERTKALWNLDRQSEARLSLKSSISGFDPDQRVALSRWFCQNETSATGCTAEARPACDWLANAVDNDKVLLRNSDIALTYLRGESCADRLSEERLADLEEKIPDEPAHSYVEALGHLANGQKQLGIDVLRKIAKDSEKAGPFFIEANARLAELATTTPELSKIRETWIDTDPAEEGWVYLGRHLMERYNQMKAWDQTLEVGFKLGESDGIDRGAARSLVVAAYRAGQPRMAFGYLETFAKSTRASSSTGAAGQSTSDRKPASSDGFEDIARELLDGSPLGPRSMKRGKQ